MVESRVIRDHQIPGRVTQGPVNFKAEIVNPKNTGDGSEGHGVISRACWFARLHQKKRRVFRRGIPSSPSAINHYLTVIAPEYSP
ncbi:hypothetical protein R1flu_024094 [Riccia fluitans]|uniref:Uncharacterized protein n=1 Tax=Riccia fluitans TaxID=41844 RepID=A0ABD1XU31_9MARC